MKRGNSKVEAPKKADTKLSVKKGPERGKDPNTPKRPQSAFFIFIEEFRKTFKEKNPNNKSVAAVAKAGGDKWKSLTEEEKAPYVAKAVKLKADYTKTMAAYNKGQSGGGGGSSFYTCPPKYWQSSQYSIQPPSQGISQHHSPGIQSNESRSAGVDASNSANQTTEATNEYEHVWRIVKDSPMYAPQSSGRRATKKVKTSESSGVHTDSSNNHNTTIDVDDKEVRSHSIRQKAAKRKGKERIGLIDELNQVMQQSLVYLQEYNNNKKVDQLIQAHQLFVMDTRGMTDEQFQNHQIICEQLKKRLNM